MPDFVDIKDRSPNPVLVDYCRNLLSDVESGEVRSITCILGHDDDSISTMTIHDFRNNSVRLVGALELLKFEILGIVADG